MQASSIARLATLLITLALSDRAFAINFQAIGRDQRGRRRIGAPENVIPFPGRRPLKPRFWPPGGNWPQAPSWRCGKSDVNRPLEGHK